MKHALMLLAGLVLALARVGTAEGQTQLASTGVNYGAWTTVKLTVVDPEHIVIQQELMGVRLDDSGKGPLHKLATHISLLVFVDKGVLRYSGFETHSDKDGDKVVWEMGGDDRGGSNKGTGRIIAATGKFAGMEGTMEFVVEPVQGFPEGTGRTICRESMRLTLRKPL